MRGRRRTAEDTAATPDLGERRAHRIAALRRHLRLDDLERLAEGRDLEKEGVEEASARLFVGVGSCHLRRRPPSPHELLHESTGERDGARGGRLTSNMFMMPPRAMLDQLIWRFWPGTTGAASMAILSWCAWARSRR